MARLFDNASPDEYLARNQVVLATMPCAYVCFFYADELGDNLTLMGTGDKDVNVDSQLMYLSESAGNKVRGYQESSAAAGSAYSSLAYSLNTWTHACVIFASSTDRRALTNAGSKGTNSTAVTPANFDRTTIGVWPTSVTVHGMSGRIAEVAIYDLSGYPGATATDKADYFEANVLPNLSAGDEPPFFTTGLIAHWPLIDDDEDHVGEFDMTPYNSPSWAAHPPMKRRLAGTAAASSTAVGALTKLTFKALAGTSSISTTTSGTLEITKKLIGTAAVASTSSGALKLECKLAGTSAIESTTAGSIKILKTFVGAAAVACTAIGVLTRIGVQLLAGYAEITSTAVGNLISYTTLAGTSVIRSTAVGATLIIFYKTIPPFMHKDLIDPYGTMGAWLWLAEIVVPTQTTQRIARNTADVIYGGITFNKSNFDPPGRIPLTGDGSIPRIQLRVAQDGTGTLEDIVNATKGGKNGTVKLIRTCEKYFEMPVSELERTYDILTAGSDSMWVTFSLGIPNPLTQRIPLWSYSSKVCPLATPSLYKGPRCQCVHADAVCTGLLGDCRTKGNAVHWGAEIGLDPNAVRV